MKALSLEEFAQDMRRKGDIRQADLADEILMLIDVEGEVAEPYSELCGGLEDYAKGGGYEHADKPEKALEWLGDRSNLLGEIEKELDEDGRTGDTDDQVKAMLETLAKIREIVGLEGGTDEDLEIAVQALVDRAPPEQEYDL